MGFLSGLFGPRVQVITSPRAGVLNLLGASVADLAERDAQFLEPLFGKSLLKRLIRPGVMCSLCIAASLPMAPSKAVGAAFEKL